MFYHLLAQLFKVAQKLLENHPSVMSQKEQSNQSGVGSLMQNSNEASVVAQGC